LRPNIYCDVAPFGAAFDTRASSHLVAARIDARQVGGFGSDAYYSKSVPTDISMRGLLLQFALALMAPLGAVISGGIGLLNFSVPATFLGALVATAAQQVALDWVQGAWAIEPSSVVLSFVAMCVWAFGARAVSPRA
jgi:hypothetical protein